MYHLELRHFPHNACRFNLRGDELWVIVELWARGQVVELGEHHWSPHQASMTIIEGPEIPVGQLTMGRGWRIAQRQGQDVTEQVLAAVRQRLVAARASANAATPAGVASAHGASVSPPAAPASDAFDLGIQMAVLLGPQAMRLLDAWRTAAASSPGIAPSEALAQAERAIRSPDASKS